MLLIRAAHEEMDQSTSECVAKCVCLAPKWRSPEKVHANLKLWNVETLPILPDPIIEEGKDKEYAKSDRVREG